MAASDQLSKLSARAKEAEDRVAAAQGKAKADLEQDVKQARETAQADADQLHKDAEEGKGKVSAWWHDVQRSWHEHVAAIREDFDRKRAENDKERARRSAENAEDDAVFAIRYAEAAIDEAEYAVLDAALTRAEATTRSHEQVGASISRAQTRIVASVAQLTAVHLRGIPARYGGAGASADEPSPTRSAAFVRSQGTRLWLAPDEGQFPHDADRFAGLGSWGAHGRRMWRRRQAGLLFGCERSPKLGRRGRRASTSVGPTLSLPSRRTWRRFRVTQTLL